MTNSAFPSLLLSRLIVAGKGVRVYDETFRRGVNIIRGDNSSGKSTIADFIFYVLGGDNAKWKPPADNCDAVFAEVTMGGSVLTLRREVSSSARRPMAIYWGSYEEASMAGPSAWQIFQFQRSQSKESFSQVLFRTLGIPEVRGEFDSNITMHQLLRLLYVDQLSNVQSLLRDEPFDAPLTRRTIGDLLLGVYDDSVYQDELALRDSLRMLDHTKAQVQSLVQVLAEVEQETDVKAIQKKIDEKEEQFARVRQTLSTYDSTRSIEAGQISEQIEQRRQAYVEAQRELGTLRERLTVVAFDIDDSERFILTLESRLSALDQSATTRDALEGLSITYCPACLAPIEIHQSADVCGLCKTPFDSGAYKTRISQMKQEIVFQIKESQNLLETKKVESAKMARSLSEHEGRAAMAKKQLDDELGRVRTKRNRDLDELLVKKGQLESEILGLQKQAKAVSLLQQLEENQGLLTARIDRLRTSISQKRNKEAEHMQLAVGTIGTIAAQLLRQDLQREEEFMNATDVTIDFDKNSFWVNGRNTFSASSIVYLKNCVHYAIFFASLNLDFFRYPRFLLCDNMEDKGMEQDRSHNFQRSIVKMANEFSTPFQVIFTTSMIAPEFEDSDVCVGKHYTQQAKSLRVART